MNKELKELIVRLETRTRQLILQQEKLQEEQKSLLTKLLVKLVLYLIKLQT